MCSWWRSCSPFAWFTEALSPNIDNLEKIFTLWFPCGSGLKHGAQLNILSFPQVAECVWGLPSWLWNSVFDDCEWQQNQVSVLLTFWYVTSLPRDGCQMPGCPDLKWQVHSLCVAWNLESSCSCGHVSVLQFLNMPLFPKSQTGGHFCWFFVPDHLLRLPVCFQGPGVGPY